VILNLLINAEHAIASSSGSGTITVETSGNGVVQAVEVTDSGPGISPELRGKIFEPFFTTREVGEGTGLGLSISHGIASSHGGALALMESPSGARFRLTLPAPAGSAALPSATGGAVRALVVDDDVPIRKLIVRLLEKRGYEVSEADTGESAIALALDRRPSIVICDTAVPGMTGLDLYRRLVAQDVAGAPRFLFISGDKTSTTAVDSDLAGIPVLTKPFTATDLETALAEAGIAMPRL